MTPDSAPPSMLEQISTCWPTLGDPVQFVMRYAPAIRRYVGAIVTNPHDAEEVTQDFLVKVLEHGFRPENVSRGRFRDYLRGAVRHVAIDHVRRRRPELPGPEVLDQLSGPDPAREAERVFAGEWRQCPLNRVWQSLESQQRQTPGAVDYTVLQTYLQSPGLDSQQQAERLSDVLGRPVRADAYRKHLSRARERFATRLLAEIRKTLQFPTRDAIEEELADLELGAYVADYLDPT